MMKILAIVATPLLFGAKRVHVFAEKVAEGTKNTIRGSKFVNDNKGNAPFDSRYLETAFVIDDYFILESPVVRQGGCLGFQKREGNTRARLRLTDCDACDYALQWKLDTEGRFHSKVEIEGKEGCMRVGSNRQLMLAPCRMTQNFKFNILGCGVGFTICTHVPPPVPFGDPSDTGHTAAGVFYLPETTLEAALL